MPDETKPTPKPVKPTSGKYFDVTPAKDTIASTTSRPVIVGHSNGMQKDPMVASGNEEKVGVSESESKISVKREKVLEPVSAGDPNDTGFLKAETGDDTGVKSTIDDDPQLNQSSEAESIDTGLDNNSVKSVDNPDNQESGAVDAIVSEVNTKKEREKDEDERLKREAEVAELAASKKYYLKIQTPASKRKARLMIVLLMVLVFGGVGWYFGVGPGVELWSKDVATQTSTTTTTSQAAASTSTETTQQPKQATKATFADAKLGLAFSYPSDWKIAQAKDSEFATRDVLTLTSPAEKLTIIGSENTPVEAEVFFRTRIFAENTINPKEYASDLVKMTSCSSEDLVVSGTTMKVLFLDYQKPDPAVSQIALSPENCVKAGSLFNGNDQVQFASKKNTYIVYSEIVFSENHLKKNGATTAEAIAIAQEKGVSVNKPDLLKSTQYAKFKEILSSLREEITP